MTASESPESLSSTPRASPAGPAPMQMTSNSSVIGLLQLGRVFTILRQGLSTWAPPAPPYPAEAILRACPRCPTAAAAPGPQGCSKMSFAGWRSRKAPPLVSGGGGVEEVHPGQHRRRSEGGAGKREAGCALSAQQRPEQDSNVDCIHHGVQLVAQPSRRNIGVAHPQSPGSEHDVADAEQTAQDAGAGVVVARADPEGDPGEASGGQHTGAHREAQ